MKFIDNINITKILGYILLTPPLLSVLVFLFQLITHHDVLHIFEQTAWSGDYFVDSVYGGGGYTSALPLNFGLMAIAGALLIKDSKYPPLKSIALDFLTSFHLSGSDKYIPCGALKYD